MKYQLLTAVFSESIKDDVVDALIALENISGFSMTATDGYSRRHSQYDLREQVAGYRRLCRAEVVHPEAQEHALLATLESLCGASHIRYWITSLASAGQLGSGSD
jgi:hypothetical protein